VAAPTEAAVRLAATRHRPAACRRAVRNRSAAATRPGRSAVARHDRSVAAHPNRSVREVRSRFKVHRPIDPYDHSATARAEVRSAPNHLAELRPTAAVYQAAHRTIARRSSAPMAIKRSRDLSTARYRVVAPGIAIPGTQARHFAVGRREMRP